MTTIAAPRALQAQAARRVGTWIGLLPLLAWQAAFYAVPLGILLLASFWQLERHQLVADWTLANYAEVFGKAYHLTAWLESLWLTASVVVAATLLGYTVAFVIAFVVPPRWRPVLLVVVVAPFWTNYLVRAYSWSIVLSGAGPINFELKNLGIISAPIQLLYTPLATRIGLTHFLSVLVTLFVYTRIEAIDRRILEAAHVLGSNAWQTFTNILLPLTSSAAKVAIVVVVVFAFADYVSPAVLGGQNPPLFSQQIVDSIMDNTNWPQAAAFAVVMVLSILALVAAVSRIPAPDARDLA
jgi:spermidine/putrescine transport system permease protein